MKRLWLALILSLALGGPAAAEMTSQDIRDQMNAVFVERQHQIDSRIDTLEKQMAARSEADKALLIEREKLRESDMRTTRTNIDDNVKFFSAQLGNIRDAGAAHAQQIKEAQATAFATQQEQIKAAFAAAKEAVDKAAIATEKRFDSVNEFRAQLKDQQALLMPRAEAEGKIRGNGDAIVTLTARLDQISGRSQGADATWITLSGGIGLLIGAAGVAVALMRRRSDLDHISDDRASLAIRIQRLEGKAA